MEMRNHEHALRWLEKGALAPQPGMAPEDDKDRRARELALAFRIAPGALQTILEMSVFRPGVDHRLPPGQYEQYAQLRQGQDQLAAAILEYLAHAQTLDRKPANEHPVDVERTEDLESARRSVGWGDPGWRVG